MLMAFMLRTAVNSLVTDIHIYSTLWRTCLNLSVRLCYTYPFYLQPDNTASDNCEAFYQWSSHRKLS